MRNIQEMYLSLGKKVLIFDSFKEGEKVNKKYLVAFTLNIQCLGFMPSKAIIDKLATLTQEEFEYQTNEILIALKELNGGRQNITPMYPDFPHFVMEADEMELYFNAFLHYWSGGQWLPKFEESVKLNTKSLLALKHIDLGSENDLREYTYRLANSSVAMSNSQKEYLQSLICRYFDSLDITKFNMTNKENLVYTIYWFYRYGHRFANILSMDYLNTSTDVLRLSMIMLDADYTLASHNHHFKSLKRKDRRFLLACLEGVCKTNKQTIEDAARYQGLWIAVGEVLHPGDYSGRYPNAFKFISSLRKDKAKSWYSLVEKAYNKKDVKVVVEILQKRPGEFARRLERTLRLAYETNEKTSTIINAFADVANEIDNTILLQLAQQFVDRATKTSTVRSFMIKGNTSKVYAKDETRDRLRVQDCILIASICNEILFNKYKQKESLGKVYVANDLDGYAVPLKLRNASKQMHTLARGSRIAVPKETNVIRMYTWWKNNTKRDYADIDLSAVFFNEDWSVNRHIAFHDLRSKDIEAAHSGDITDAPNGAAEYIDFNINKAKEAGIRYVAMTINSFSGQYFSELNECFGGVMILKESVPHEKVFDPTKSIFRSDIASNSTMCVPAIFDTHTREIIWVDCSVSYPRFRGNVAANHEDAYTNTIRAVVEASYPQFTSLVSLHVNARAEEIVDNPEEADTIFSLDKGLTPYSIEEINSEWIN